MLRRRAWSPRIHIETALLNRFGCFGPPYVSLHLYIEEKKRPKRKNEKKGGGGEEKFSFSAPAPNILAGNLFKPWLDLDPRRKSLLKTFNPFWVWNPGLLICMVTRRKNLVC